MATKKGRVRGPSLATLKRILSRQFPPRFGADYVPSTRAVREEAPSVSGANISVLTRLERRLHSLSKPEQMAFPFALYNEHVFEAFDQFALPVRPAPHMLSFHPKYAMLGWPSFSGSLEAARRLDALEAHPTVSFADEFGQAQTAPFPILGDLLLFIDNGREVYGVNWTIKSTAEGFRTPLLEDRPARDPEVAAWRERMRHCIEEETLRQVDIRTQRIVRADIAPGLAANLQALLTRSARPIDIPVDDQDDVVTQYRACLRTGERPLDLILWLHDRHGYAVEALQELLYRAIWTRRLRVDLWSAICLDQPLIAEQRDVLDVYRGWFAKEEVHV